MFHVESIFEMNVTFSVTSIVLILLPDKLWPLSDLNFGVKLALSVRDIFSVNLSQELHTVFSYSTFQVYSETSLHRSAVGSIRAYCTGCKNVHRPGPGDGGDCHYCHPWHGHQKTPVNGGHGQWQQ